MSSIEEIRENIVYNIHEEVESYFAQRYPILDVKCTLDSVKVEDIFGIASLNLWVVVRLSKPIKDLEINIEEHSIDLNRQLKEYLAQDYTIHQFIVKGGIDEESVATNDSQLEFTISIELGYEEEPIEWDVEDWFPITTERFPKGYFVTKGEFSRLERIFLAYLGSKFVDEKLDLLEAIGLVFDLIVGSALMDNENTPGGILSALLDAYQNFKMDLKE